MAKTLAIIGDLHGRYETYLELVRNADYSIQLGDFGFDYGILDLVDPDCHKIIGGNHDNYNLLPRYPHYLGDFGLVNLGGFEFFFIRGALSIDKGSRQLNISYWQDEELTYSRMVDAFDSYCATKPNIVLTHCAPSSIISKFSDFTDEQIWQFFGMKVPSSTDQLLEMCLRTHKPKEWIFGHYHKTKTVDIFSCLGIEEHRCRHLL